MISALQKCHFLLSIIGFMEEAVTELSLSDIQSKLKKQHKRLSKLQAVAEKLEIEKLENRERLSQKFVKKYSRIEATIKGLSRNIFTRETDESNFLKLFALNDESKTSKQVIEDNITAAKNLLHQGKLMQKAELIKQDMLKDSVNVITTLVNMARCLTDFKSNEYKEYNFYINYKFKNFADFIKLLELIINSSINSDNKIYKESSIELLSELAEVFIKESNQKVRSTFLRQENHEENTYLRQSSTITARILHRLISDQLGQAIDTLAVRIEPYLKHTLKIQNERAVLFHSKKTKFAELKQLFTNFLQEILQFFKNNTVIIESISADLNARNSNIDIKKIVIFSLIYPIVDTLLQHSTIKDKLALELRSVLDKDLKNAFSLLFGFSLLGKNSNHALVCEELAKIFTDESLKKAFESIFPQTRQRSKTHDGQVSPRLNFPTKEEVFTVPNSSILTKSARSVSTAPYFFAKNNINSMHDISNINIKSALNDLFLRRLKAHEKIVAKLLANAEISVYIQSYLTEEEFNNVKNSVVMQLSQTPSYVKDELLEKSLNELISQIDHEISDLKKNINEHDLERLSFLQELLPIRFHLSLKNLHGDAFNKKLIMLLEQNKVRNSDKTSRVVKMLEGAKREDDPMAYEISQLFQKREHVWTSTISKLTIEAEIFKLQAQKQIIERFNDLLTPKTEKVILPVETTSTTNSPNFTTRK